MDQTDHIASQFKVGELVLIAEELGLAPANRWGQRKLVDVINKKLQKEGLPEPPESDDNLTRSQNLLEEFLFIAGYVDEAGNVVKQDQEDYEITLQDFMAAHELKKLPDCFSTADDEDPSCARCIVYKFCAEERIALLPPCFGILYEVNHPECEACLEAPFCKLTVMKGDGKNEP